MLCSIDHEKYIVHENVWWWGYDYCVICKGGEGKVELQFDISMPDTLYIKGLSVLREKRRQGIARELLSLCESVGRQANKAFLRLSCERNNTWLFEWYKRLGFRIFDIEENVFDMVKTL